MRLRQNMITQLYQIKIFLVQLRLTSNNDYEFVRWLICVFIAGAVYSIILYQFGTQLGTLLPQLELPTIQNPDVKIDLILVTQMSMYALILLAIPPLFSITATRLIPEKRIVPPFYIHMIAVGYMSFYFSTQHFMPNIWFLNIFVLFMYSIFIGLTHDIIVQTILGRNVREKDLLTYSFKIKNINVKNLENLFMSERHRRHFRLDGRIEEIDDGVRLRNTPDIDTRMIIEIKTDKDDVLLNLLFFERGRYYFKYTDMLIDDAKEKSRYIEDLIKEKFNNIEKAPEQNAVLLKEDILERAGGLSSQVDKISRIGWAKIISFIIVVAIAISLIVFDYMTEGITTLAVVLLYVIFDLPRKLLSRRH